jgi:GH15 family glucan-1,4-alpha-glucosidase
MRNERSARLLSDHGIGNYQHDGSLMAESVWSTADGQRHSEWIDVTGWTSQTLLAWLGY